MSEIHEISELLLPALWRASWQGGLAIAALWCFCRALRRYFWFTADLRCWLWRAAYVKLLVSLAVSGSVVLPVLPARPYLPDAPQTITVYTVIPTAAASTFPASLQLAASQAFPWQTAAAILYLIGVSVCLIRIVRAGLRTRHLLQEASPPESADAEAEIVHLASHFGLGRVPRLRVSARTTVPVYAAGIVLLPAAAYTPEECRLIFAHELAHARRRDLVWEWLGTLTHAIFFFHPLVLLARREERLARESATDAFVLRLTQAPALDYGKLLLSIALASQNTPPQLAGAIAVVDKGRMLRHRLLALKEVSTMPVSSTRRVLVSILFLVVALVLLIPWRITQAAQSVADSASEGKLTIKILSEGQMITLYYPLKEKAQANQIRISADRVVETPGGYRCTGKVVVTSSRDQKTVFTAKTNSLLVGKQGKTGSAPVPSSDNQLIGSRKVLIRAKRVASTPQGNRCEGDVTITTYQGKGIVSQIKASRAFIKTKSSMLPQSKPSGMEIELDQEGVLEIKAYNIRSAMNAKQPPAGKKEK